MVFGGNAPAMGKLILVEQRAQREAKEFTRRHRVQLAKERQDLTKIVAFVQNHNDAVRRKFVAFEEYLEAVRDQKVTVKNVYTTEAMQRGD